ncbi:uncharacterized protein LOC143291465 [Babylonia areolata]|uniref:uncharacterized protein LOC143291465 n=1 Tax=Babylonia areolata TaxID=304850 RepID=UPI003FD607CD
MRFLRIFFFIGVLAPAGASSKPNIAIDPPTLTLTHDQAERREAYVTVTCNTTYESRDTPGSRLRILSITRQFGNKSERQFAKVNETGFGKTKAPPLASGRGSLTEGVIVLHHISLTCEDGGGFFCAATYGKNPRLKSEVVPVAVKVDPGQLTLTASPRKNLINEELTMTCHGPLGNGEVDWVWQYRNTEPDDTDWISYNKGVETGPEEETGNPCIKRGSSTVKRRLSPQDTNRRYRCFVKKRGGVSFLEYAAVYDVGIVPFSAEGEEPIVHPHMVLGMGVGGCVGVVVGVIAAIGVVVVLLVRRRRRLSSMAKQTVNCPLLPKHRDPGYYGEYLEPMMQVPQQEVTAAESKRDSHYSEISNYEDIDISRMGSTSSATESKQVETSGPGASKN